MGDLYCKIYVRVPVSVSSQAVQNILHEITGGSASFLSIDTTWGCIDVLKNDDRDWKKASNVDGFLFYPYYLEIESVANLDKAVFVTEIGRILTALWSKEIGAVASCDFEEELPNKGGFTG